MIGIETLKQDLITVAGIINKVDAALVDKKITLVEWMGLAAETTRIFKVAKSYPKAKEEFQDLSEAEIKELTDAFAVKFDLTNDAAEEKVEQILSIVASIASAFVKE